MRSRLILILLIVLAFCAAAFTTIQSDPLTSSHHFATSFQNMRKIVKARSGTLAYVYQKGKAVQLAVSRDGGESWNDELEVAALSKMYPDAVIGPDDNIYLTYSSNEDSGGDPWDVHFARLLYESGSDSWVLGTQRMVFDSSSSTGGFNAVIGHDGVYLWIAYRLRSGSGYSLVVMYSADLGQNWQQAIVADPPGSDPDETGTFVHTADRMVLIYYHQNLGFKWRSHYDTDPPGTWTTGQYIGTWKLASKSDYSAVADSANRVHLLLGHSGKGVKHVVSEGGSWSAENVVSADGTRVSLTTNGTDLLALWQKGVNTSNNIYSRRYDGSSDTWNSSVSTLVGSGVNNYITSLARNGGTAVFSWTLGSNGPYSLPVMTIPMGGGSEDPLPPPPPPPGQVVTGFTLINAASDTAVAGMDPLASGATIDLFLVGAQLNLRANTSPASVGSVRFALDGNANFRTENAAPYALGGHAGSDYFPWTPALGAHTLTATPYEGPDGTGIVGTPMTIAFTVVDTTPAPPPPSGEINKTLTTPASDVGPTVVYDDGAAGDEESAAVWIGPTPGESLLFVTQTAGGRVDVWSLGTQQIIRQLTGFTRPSGIAVDQVAGTLYVADREGQNIRKYRVTDIVAGVVTPALTFTTALSPSKEPDGLAIYHGDPAGTLIYAVSSGSSERAVRAYRPDGTLHRWWSLGSNISISNIAADEENGLLYVTDGRNLLLKAFRPDGTFVRNFGQGNFETDVKDVVVYRCGGDGYVIASDGDSQKFEIFDRLSLQRLASFGVVGVQDNEGIAIAQSPLPGFPNGALFAQSNDRYISGVSWTVLAQATGMSICMDGDEAPPPPGPRVTSFTLIDADTDAPVPTFDLFADGATIDLALVGAALNVRANTDPETVGSVRFGLDGTADVLTEDTAPYALGGHAGGDYLAWTPALGAHTLTATPFDGPGGTGTAGTPLTIAFTVVDSSLLPPPPPPPPPAVTSFTLINATTGQPIGSMDPLVGGAVIDLAVVGNELSIRANTDPPAVGSVRFGLDANASYHTADAAPYALNGHTGTSYVPWTPATGAHTVTATAFDGPGATGTAGSPLSVAFTVIDSAAAAPPGDVNKILTTPGAAVGPTVVYDDQASGNEETAAVWVGPTPGESLLFVAQKSGRVDVWNLATHQIISQISGFVQPSGIVVDQAEGTLYVADREQQMIRKFLISDIRAGNLTAALTFSTSISPSREPEGLAIYRGAPYGTLIMAVSSGSSEKAIRAYRTDGTLSHWWSLGFNVSVANLAADSENGLLYVTDSRSDLIKVYRPDGTFVRDFGQGHFPGKITDVVVYRCGGDGYIIASDSDTDRFEVFDRLSYQHLGSFMLTGVKETDGMALSQSPLPGYPEGGLFAQSNDRYVLGASWTALNQATGMSVCVQ
jgi:myo-inositol-hexaphosphate 3-phosphohydrolase